VLPLLLPLALISSCICLFKKDFGGFFSVPAAKCQQSPKLLREVPRIANGLDAES
jgi:hypothetical protein